MTIKTSPQQLPLHSVVTQSSSIQVQETDRSLVASKCSALTNDDCVHTQCWLCATVICFLFRHKIIFVCKNVYKNFLHEIFYIRSVLLPITCILYACTLTIFMLGIDTENMFN